MLLVAETVSKRSSRRSGLVLLDTDIFSATTHNQDMVTLLRDLRVRATSEQQARIDDLLSAVSSYFQLEKGQF